MQRAGHLVARDFSLGQGGLFVGAHVVDREELAVDVEQGDLSAPGIDQASLTGLSLRDFFLAR
jgi:hypothetical protein